MIISKLRTFFFQGHERTVLIKKNIIFSFCIRIVSIIIGFLLIPLTINYVSPKQYGIWLTLSSLINWFNFFDIGLGNGLKNKLAEAKALNNLHGARVYISTTYAILSGISVFIFIVFYTVNHFINWKSVLNIPEFQNNELSKLTLLIASFFCIQFISQIINTVLTASHAPAKVSFINMLGQVCCLIAVFFLKMTTKGSLENMILVLAGIPIAVQIISGLVLFKFEYRDLSPRFKLVNMKFAKSLLNTGGVFFIIQIGVLVLFQTDNIVITQLFGPLQVTTFNLAYKLFSVVIMVFTIVMTPFWSAFTDAYSKNDWKWIKDVLSKMQQYWIYLSIITILLLVFSKILYRIWLGSTINIPFSLSLVMGIYVIAYCWQTIHVYLLNGINKIRLQLYLVIISSVINLPLAILLGKYIGLAGVTLANAVVFIVMGIIFSIQTNKIVNNTATGIWNK